MSTCKLGFGSLALLSWAPAAFAEASPCAGREALPLIIFNYQNQLVHGGQRPGQLLPFHASREKMASARDRPADSCLAIRSRHSFPVSTYSCSKSSEMPRLWCVSVALLLLRGITSAWANPSAAPRRVTFALDTKIDGRGAGVMSRRKRGVCDGVIVLRYSTSEAVFDHREASLATLLAASPSSSPDWKAPPSGRG